MLKNLKNIKKSKKIYFLLFLYMVALTTTTYAGMFDEFNKLNSEVFSTTHKNSGLLLRLLISLVPPLLFIAVPLGTYVYQKRDTSQNKEDTMKIIMYVSGSTIAGYVAGIVIIYMVGMGTFIKHGGGDKSLEVMSTFWASAVAGKKYDEFKSSNQASFQSANKLLNN